MKTSKHSRQEEDRRKFVEVYLTKNEIGYGTGGLEFMKSMMTKSVVVQQARFSSENKLLLICM